MNKVRRDVVLGQLRQRRWRLVLTLLFMPDEYVLEHRDYYRPSSRRWR